jgi:hypothetical protein
MSVCDLFIIGMTRVRRPLDGVTGGNSMPRPVVFFQSSNAFDAASNARAASTSPTIASDTLEGETFVR